MLNTPSNTNVVDVKWHICLTTEWKEAFTHILHSVNLNIYDMLYILYGYQRNVKAAKREVVSSTGNVDMEVYSASFASHTEIAWEETNW